MHPSVFFRLATGAQTGNPSLDQLMLRKIHWKGWTMAELNNEVRFGKMAVDMGIITMDQMLNAIEVQVKENIAFGTHRKIGMILLEQGHINSAQIDEVLKEMQERIQFD